MVKKVMKGPIGERIYSSAERIYPEIRLEVEHLLEQKEGFLKLETYLTCLSLHKRSEDRIGRLSMWRAYGDVALVMNNKPFLTNTDKHGVILSPVYYGEKDIKSKLNDLAELIEATPTVSKCPNEEDYQERLIGLFSIFFEIAMVTKHLGFSEEEEWRLYFHPHKINNPLLERRIENIAGILQPIYALKLKDDPDNGMHKADIPNLLDRIIIGPTSQPHVIKSAFVELLTDAGVENAKDKVYVSDIPLRSSSR